MAAKRAFRITYTSLGVGKQRERFHRLYDKAVARIRAMAGGTYPHLIANKPVRGRGAPFTDRSPTDTRVVLARFRNATDDEIDAAVRTARAAYRQWGVLSYKERVRLMRRAASLIRRNSFELAAVMSLEVGKNRLEAMGDVEEAADLIDYYAQTLLAHDGYHMRLGRLSPREETSTILRPYGVWAVIAPFNFPLALSAGMSAGALLAGNTVVFKPSEDAAWTGYRLAEIYRDAGLPPGVFNMLTGDGATGETIVSHPGIDGVVFTGSRAVGTKIFRHFTRKSIRPAIIEMGGKNPAIVTASARAELAAEGVMRSAFGLQGQKCSACSRVYVDRKIKNAFLHHLLAKTAALTIGDPTRRDIYLGPVISMAGVARFRRAVAEARKGGGAILYGGELLRGGDLRHGYFVAPTIVDGLPRMHRLFRDELFLPYLVVTAVDSLEQAVQYANNVDYGLTAGIYSKRKNELRYFFENIEAGVTYANRRSGATTGAWPGVQSFCGWKTSGSTGKGACGPYYVQQFMREQSRTVMK